MVTQYFIIIDKTLSGDSLTLAKSKEDGKATVNDVSIVQSDILGANGKFIIKESM
jgi:hypothetical protein